MNSLTIDKLSPKEWATLSENAHLVVFDEERPNVMERLDFALLVLKDQKIISYATIKELDNTSVYWQYGGAIPAIRGTTLSFKAYMAVHKWCFDNGFTSISTHTKNTNTKMLKFAIKMGFIIIGTKTYRNEVYLDLLKEL